ncbi:molybdopterin oxidoreductase [Pseudodesulfovibrio mercurii]|uniref:Molybdopterin oxidoreductase n=1 Tax=Pseudodesulfovibrio mercurii TaxID=641491 RepID=F0JFJ7_9BACT|nr:molybdopterin-dependent oxidoreductase [Pseudodesulfovibrio mercurii]EGB14921.1 molybdopterin oxidoreductase [Pseudodesulfovibrio mercurii]
MWKRAVCTKDCPDTCGLLVKVENGRITSVKGDPDHPYTRGFLCGKGARFPEHVHGAARLTTPLKRTGPKGSGAFAPISWDEALDEVAANIRRVADAYGPEAILPYTYAGHMGMVHRYAGHALFNKLGASRLDATICGPAATAGFKATLGKGPSTEIQEAAQSDLVVIWGNNTLVTNVHAWPHFLKARKNGARIIVIDPYRNATAREADAHLMLRPGTDAALALAVMHVLVTEDLVDHEFIAAQTIGFDRLKERVLDWPPARAAEICDLAEPDIVAFARAYGRARAPYIRTGWGPARQLAGGMAMRTISLLPALVNAFGKPGGGITRSLGGAPGKAPSLIREDLRPAGTRTVNMVHLGRALTELADPPVMLLYNYLSNPAAVAPQSAQVMAGLAREDLFTVVHELYMTDTARFADIILPGASFLEVGDIYRSYGHNHVQIARPVIDPVGDSRSTLDIFQDLARRLGFTEEVFSLSEAQCIERILDEADSPYLDGVDLDALRRGEPVRLNIPANPFAGGFDTPSGKVECFSQSMADQGLDPLPDGTPVRDPEGGEEYPLEYITPPHPMLLNSAFNEIETLRERIGGPKVLIHPATAAARGITQGMTVRVFNARGRNTARAEITEDTRPELLVAEGLHRVDGTPGQGSNQLTSQRLTDMGNTCAFHCNKVQVEPVG